MQHASKSESLKIWFRSLKVVSLIFTRRILLTFNEIFALSRLLHLRKQGIISQKHQWLKLATFDILIFNMVLRLSGQASIFGVSLLGIEGQKKHEKCAILIRKPRIHARILIYRASPISIKYTFPLSSPWFFIEFTGIQVLVFSLTLFQKAVTLTSSSFVILRANSNAQVKYYDMIHHKENCSE